MDEQSREPVNAENKQVEDKAISEVSIERSESSSNRSSKRNRRSLIQVMSIEGSDLNDSIYQYYLVDDVKKSRNRSLNRSSNSRDSNAENSIESEQLLQRRRSSTSRVLGHQCSCDDNNCIGFHCSCYSSPDEICLMDNCCPNCIKMKNQRIKNKLLSLSSIRMKVGKTSGQDSASALQANGTENNPTACQSRTGNGNDDKANKNMKLKVMVPFKAYNKVNNAISCSCKKSHCLKKYCACFANGQQCSPSCVCLDCCNTIESNQNMQDCCDNNGKNNRTTENDQDFMDIDKYLQTQDYEKKMMPSSMEFQPPDMTLAFHY